MLNQTNLAVLSLSPLTLYEVLTFNLPDVFVQQLATLVSWRVLYHATTWLAVLFQAVIGIQFVLWLQ